MLLDQLVSPIESRRQRRTVCDDDKRRAFRAAFDRLSARIEAFLDLPLETLAPEEAAARLRDIGRMP